MAIKERYFGERDPLEIQEYEQESPAAAAIRQAKQIAKSPPKVTLMEKLLEERTKDALEGAQKQVRQIAESAEKRVQELQQKLELYAEVLQHVVEGSIESVEVLEFLKSRK